MKLTVRLPDQMFSSYAQGLISLGTPLHLFLMGDILLARDYDAEGGWYERVAGPQEPRLLHIDGNRYVFCGEVLQTELSWAEDDLYYFVLLDCGLPVSLITGDPGADLGSGDLGRQIPEPGRWLIGIMHLSLVWDDLEIHPATQAVTGTVVEIERLIMRPGPGFGERRSEEKLHPTPLAPDQVFLTLDIRQPPDTP